MATEYKAIHPLEYYRSYLQRKIRPDGRKLMEARPVVLNIRAIKTADASSIVKHGNSTVVCGVKLELAAPKVDSPKIGYLVPNVELSPMCSARFKPGPPGEKAQVMSQLLADIVNMSKCIDLGDLCIEEGKLVWCMYCDILCLDYDGSVGAACLTALIAALSTLTIPKVTYDSTLATFKVDSSERKALKVWSQPVASTFAIFDEDNILADPTAEEEGLATGLLTVVMLPKGICYLDKPGGSPLTEQQMKDFIAQARMSANHVRSVLKQAL